jgi:hypothetical protein
MYRMLAPERSSQAASFLVRLVNGRAISANLGINRRYQLQVGINVSNCLTFTGGGVRRMLSILSGFV